jgi:hypothetical protein
MRSFKNTFPKEHLHNIWRMRMIMNDLTTLLLSGFYRQASLLQTSNLCSNLDIRNPSFREMYEWEWIWLI